MSERLSSSISLSALSDCNIWRPSLSGMEDDSLAMRLAAPIIGDIGSTENFRALNAKIPAFEDSYDRGKVVQEESESIRVMTERIASEPSMVDATQKIGEQDAESNHTQFELESNENTISENLNFNESNQAVGSAHFSDEKSSESLVPKLKDNISPEEEAALKSLCHYYVDSESFQLYADAYKSPALALKRKKLNLAWVENELNETARATEKRKIANNGDGEKKHFEYAEAHVPTRALIRQLDGQKEAFKAEVHHINKKASKYGWLKRIDIAEFGTYSRDEAAKFLKGMIQELETIRDFPEKREKRKEYYLKNAKKILLKHEKTYGAIGEISKMNYKESSAIHSEEEFTE